MLDIISILQYLATITGRTPSSNIEKVLTIIYCRTAEKRGSLNKSILENNHAWKIFNHSLFLNNGSIDMI